MHARCWPTFIVGGHFSVCTTDTFGNASNHILVWLSSGGRPRNEAGTVRHSSVVWFISSRTILVSMSCNVPLNNALAAGRCRDRHRHSGLDALCQGLDALESRSDLSPPLQLQSSSRSRSVCSA
jgi:hypothetical protein